ncbi:flagellar biosynthesis protein FliQ [Gallaecimonas mangrovi]|uniref:flagellar biosynthesis protein FliQ n=1 Tax=Gallaecimonas mangrovi TaxID=2291597 RepID=UPI000E2036BD|nr:flagellar biosynthesis protein FliQ [Gallaecimonas mangrovi]
MTPEQAVALIYNAVVNIILIVGVLILPGMVVGLIVSVFQAATQINEQTLSFLPRLLVTLGMLAFAGHWILQRIMDLFHTLFYAIPGAIG